MSTNLSNPVLFPDDVLLNQNSTTGKVQIKPQTQGDLLKAGVSGVFARLPMGTALQLLRVNSGGTDLEYATVGLGEGWTYLTKTTVSGATTGTASGLTAYNEYLVVGKCRQVSGSSGVLGLRLNADTGANYTSRSVNGTTWSAATAQSSVVVGITNNTNQTYFAIRISGVTEAVASGTAGIIVNADAGLAGNQGIGGCWTGGNGVQVSSVTLFNSLANNIEMVFEVFGRNRN